MTEGKIQRNEYPSSDENGISNDAKDSVGPSIPDWVNADLFTDLLKKSELEFKEIRIFKVKPAVAPSENYTTIMLKIEIEANAYCEW